MANPRRLHTYYSRAYHCRYRGLILAILLLLAILITIMPKNPLFDLLSSDVKLKPTATVVRGRGGSVKIERKEFLTKDEQAAQLSASKEAGRKRGEDQPEAHNTQEQFAGSGSSRVFPSWEGNLYEFVPNGGALQDTFRYGYWEVVARSDQEKKDSWKTSIFGNNSNNNGSSSSRDPARSSSSSQKPIKIVTYNIWFDTHEWKKRTEALIEMLLQIEYTDIICLQEVTPRVLEYILKKEDIRKLYYVVDKGPDYKTLGSYGVTMLIRKTLPPPTITWISLPTNMGRSALVASFEAPPDSSLTAIESAPDTIPTTTTKSTHKTNSGLAIATVHLESLDNQETRAKQLKRIRMALQNYGMAVLVGDYNITPTGRYANPKEHQNLQSLLEGYDDLWSKEHGTDGDHQDAPKFLDQITFNPTINTMLRSKSDYSRYDRVFARFDDPSASSISSPSLQQLEAHDIRIIGNRAIGPNLFVSDHFGLAFEISK